jgi:hypothetical protein
MYPTGLHAPDLHPSSFYRILLYTVTVHPSLRSVRSAPSNTIDILPPSPSPSIRLYTNLLLLLPLKPLHFATVLLVLAHPVLSKPAYILHKPINAAIPHPQAENHNGTPENEAQSHVYPEHYGAVHHVENLEREEEYDEEEEDSGDIGLCDKAREERREVCLDSPREAKYCGEESEDGTVEGGRKESWEEGHIV